MFNPILNFEYMKIVKLLLATALMGWSFEALAQTEETKTIEFSTLKTSRINEAGIYSDRVLLNNLYDTAQLKLGHFVADIYEGALPEGVTVVDGLPQLSVSYGIQSKKLLAAFHLPLYHKKDNVIYKIKSFTIEYTEEEAPRILARNYVSNSVLSSGNWYRIGVDKRGIVKIDYNFLQSMGINPSSINPNNIRVYGNGGTNLPEAVTDTDADDLVENAIEVHASGSTFGQNDYILFYANGPLLWEPNANKNGFVHTQNHYENKSFYFLNFDQGAGKRVANATALSGGTLNINEFNEYALVEQDSINIGALGKSWYGHQVSRNNSINIPVDLKALNGDVKYDFKVAGKTDAGTVNYSLKYLNQTLGQDALNAVDGYSSYFRVNENSGTGTFTPSSFNLTFSNSASSINAMMYLDYIRFNYSRPLSLLSNQQLNFRSFQQLQATAGTFVNYNLSNVNSNLKIWDVSNPLNPQKIAAQISGSQASFTDSGNVLKEYIAFDGSNFSTPTFVGTVANQNLHGLSQAEYLIITNNELKPAAERLANLHRSKYGTSVHVVTVDKIYNEFSSGGQDIGGIRNFIRMFYDRTNGTNDLKNVLLFGAASYDYKDRVANNTNLVPVFETIASFGGNSSFSTDEYYALLDAGESVNKSNNLNNYNDVGVGRIPSRNLQQANDYVAKAEQYISSGSFGEWKTNTSFIADDYEKSNAFNFLGSIEEMTDALNATNPIFMQSKLYADAVPHVATAGGVKFPAVTRGINNQIFNGTFLMNYIGHGSPQRWAAEEILFQGDVDRWNNIDKMPIIITATCDFGRFDKPEEESVGAIMVTRKDGGAIAALTTTQVVYEGTNNMLNKAYLESQFTQLSNGAYLSFGEAFMEAKNRLNILSQNQQNQSSTQDNSRKFVVLGDPALRPALPTNKVAVDSIFENRGNEELVLTDSLKALGRYVFKGSVSDFEGNPKNTFNGQVYVTIYDKEKVVMATHPALLAAVAIPEPQKDYKLQNSILFKGNTIVENGMFSIDVIIPKDINFDLGKGKIVLYAHDDKEEAAGSDTSIIVGAYSQFAGTDNQPPIVKPYIDNNKFRSGDIVSADPLLYVELEDNNGINVSGSSIGHDLIAVIDGDWQNPYVLNSFYQTAPNDFTKGSLYYQLSKLEPGKHTITVRAWDVYNNSGEGSIDFVVKESNEVDFNLYNYPNPFNNITNIVLQHNQPNVEMEVTLKIFGTNGALVFENTKEMRPTGSFTQWQWDGTSHTGAHVGNGVYMYQVSIKTNKGISKTLYNKLVFVR